MKKGMTIAGLVLGIVGTCVSLCAVVFSAIAVMSSRKK